MAFRDLDEFLVDKPIRLPIRGKTYEFPGSISGRTMLMLRRMADAAAKADSDSPADLSAEVLTDGEEFDLRGELMGDTEDEMVADGLSSAHIGHVFRTLVVWHMAGEEAAQAAWETQGEAPAPNRAARRASKGSASTTRSQASTSGTSTRSRKPAAKAATRGRTSSPAGR